MTDAIMRGSEPFSADGGPDGVLVLHGYTGNPSTMRPLAEAIARVGYAVECPRLPGHGTVIEDLLPTTWADYAAAALAAYDALARRADRVAVVGLSVGGALASLVAESRPVAGLVYVNPFVSPMNEELLDGLVQFLDAGVTVLDGVGSDIKSEVPPAFPPAYDATPLAPLKTICDGVAEVRDNLGRIDVPVLLFTSREDHVIVWERAEELVARVAGPVEQIWLENSFHVATLDNDAPLIESRTLDFLAGVLHP